MDNQNTTITAMTKNWFNKNTTTIKEPDDTYKVFTLWFYLLMISKSKVHNNIDIKNDIIIDYKLRNQLYRKALFLSQILSIKDFLDLLSAYSFMSPSKMTLDQAMQYVQSDTAILSTEDVNMTIDICDLYPLDLINESTIIPMADLRFLLTNEDADKLTDSQKETLLRIAEANDVNKLDSPVYVSIEDDILIIS